MSELTPTTEYWDNATLNYDQDKYNFTQWALNIIREVEPHVTCLEELHNELEPTKLLQAQKHVQNACSRLDFMQMFDRFVAEYIPGRLNGKDYMIQRQGTLRCVIPNQTAAGRRLTFHQGIWVGNGRGLRTIWTPLTEAYGSNTMWIMALKESRELTRRVLSQEMSLDEFEEEAMQYSFPVTLEPGQSHLFTQEHIHGNINNDTDITRVSIDMRVLVEGEEFHRKLPGGYFRFPGDYAAAEESDNTGRYFVTYANWNTEFGKGIPLPMQRDTIEHYTKRNKISYTEYKFENEYLDWLPGLRNAITEKPEGIVLTSVFSLPDRKDWRDEILQLALDNNVELHFANEILVMKNSEDMSKVQRTVEFAVKEG